MEFLIYIIFFAIAYLVGTKWIERSHYESIREREKEYLDFPVLTIAPEAQDASETWVVSASTVISIDAFKKMIAGLIGIFGGSIGGYESLVDRARRESVLRMIEKARKQGADSIFNLRVETSSISKNARQTIGAVEVLVYGTAVRLGACSKSL